MAWPVLLTAARSGRCGRPDGLMSRLWTMARRLVQVAASPPAGVVSRIASIYLRSCRVLTIASAS